MSAVNGAPDWPGVAAALLSIYGALRLKDLNLSFILGVDIRKLRELISRRRMRLETYGPLPRQVGAYLLDEAQALEIVSASNCAAKAATADLVRKAFLARRLQEQGIDPTGPIVREAAQSLKNPDFCLLPLGGAALERDAGDLAKKGVE
ncbi:hypothetical protein [Methylocystis suflitae]|uniref:hypothetical protein n=1 Tax=Methylocystis suflitae TaxID=2951405 RepID=UPI00210D85B7|nr:hypothetical protein [Methylocystis suflitae]MCQ4188852.1 hypothetical protein [Methylocystis suflitae]